MVKVPIHFLAANAWKLHENYKDVTNIESHAVMRHFKTNQNIYSNNRDLLFWERIMFMVVCDMFEKYVLLLWNKNMKLFNRIKIKNFPENLKKVFAFRGQNQITLPNHLLLSAFLAPKKSSRRRWVKHKGTLWPA